MKTTKAFSIHFVWVTVPLLLPRDFLQCSNAFTASLARPWDYKYASQLGFMVKDSIGIHRIYHADTILLASSNDGAEDEESHNKPGEKANGDSLKASMYNRSGNTATQSGKDKSSLQGIPEHKRVNGSHYEEAPTVRSNFGKLFHLTRPSNFPGIVIFHMLGAYLTIHSIGATASAYWKLVLRTPAMWLTLFALLLTSSTSMVVNDYYDAKLGRDIGSRGLAGGQVPMYVARRFLNYVYAVALICTALLPGAPTRVSVTIGLMLTYWYTKHLKPITWVKNLVCAGLISLSPMTSGSAALYLLKGDSGVAMTSFLVPKVWKLVGTLFFGTMGREIIMDCTDVANDRSAGVRTVPVVFGQRFASLFALISSLLMTVVVTSGPVSEATQYFSRNGATLYSLFREAPAIVRRLGLSMLGSGLTVRRNWQVCQSKGADNRIISVAVEEGLITVLFLLGSFL